MKPQDFTYAVSRIRMRETKLFSSKTIETLISQKDYQSVIRALSELGFGDDTTSDENNIISCEQNKLWRLMSELVEDISVFDVFRIQNDFHNLKAAIKAVYANVDAESYFIEGGTIDSALINSSVKNREFSQLPEFLSLAASEASEVLLKTGDGQLCDIIIDKACLNTVNSIGKNSQYSVIKDYAELFIASANIKIAVRASKLNKSYDFYMNALADCDTLDKVILAKSAVKGFEDICSYLLNTKYKASVDYIKKSMSQFEKWCDDLLINGMKSQKYEPFSIGPLVAYVLAKQNEIKAVRLILIAKLNGLDDAKISERIREMYV